VKTKQIDPAIFIAGVVFWLGHVAGYKAGNIAEYQSGRVAGRAEGRRQVDTKFENLCPAVFKLVDNVSTVEQDADSEETAQELRSVDYFAQKLFVADAVIKAIAEQKQPSLYRLLDHCDTGKEFLKAMDNSENQSEKDWMAWHQHVDASYADELVGDANKFHFNRTIAATQASAEN